MRLVCLGGAGEIGANSYFLGGSSTSFLLDAGMHPKREGAAALPRLNAIPDEVHHILITHAHLDHVGSLPEVARRLPQARVHMSETTARFALRMLRNSANVMRRRHDQGGSSPIFGFSAVEALGELVESHPEGRTIALGRGASVRFVPAGHVPGAAGLLVQLDGRSLFYTGDTCGAEQWLVPAAQYPSGPVDVLLTESTYGANLLADGIDRDDVVSRFVAALTRVLERRRRALVPVFALGRAQELLFLLSVLMDSGRLPAVPLYLTGLARALTRIYDETRLLTPRCDPGRRLERLDFRTLGEDTLAAGGPDGPAIILASSGMILPHTISNRVARLVLGEPADAIFIVGYQDPDSPGFRVQHAAPGELVDLGDEVPPEPLRCEVERFHFRAHSSRAELLIAARQMRPRLTVLVHGDPTSSASLGGTIEQQVGRTLLPQPVTAYDV